jgi:hypothetical protein
LVDWRAHWDSESKGAPGAAASLQTLRDVLATLYPDETSIRRVAMQTPLDVAHIGFSPRAVDTWHAVLQEATHSGRLDALMDGAAGEYPEHPGLRQAIDALRQAVA